MALQFATLIFLWSAGPSFSAQTTEAFDSEQKQDPFATERRIIEYVQQNLEPGQPLVLSHLYNEVFTTPEEREVLDRLNSAFFRVPLFLVDYQTQQGRLPTLEEIAGQFGFYGPEQTDVVLSVMESDPRVPDFLTRDEETGELLDLDLEKVRNDPRFNSFLDRSLDWEGRVIPDLVGTTFAGSELRITGTDAEVTLLYVWFTYCPPCVRMTPQLVALQKEYGERGFRVLGANADRVLGLTYTDADRAEYVEQHGVNFSNFHLSEEDRAALGNVNIFPTMFLIGRDKVVDKYYVNYQDRAELQADIESLLDSVTSGSD